VNIFQVYSLQHNLVFVALQHLDAATFQVLYQTKIITTALFSVVMLNKSLTYTKWISLFLLTQGVILVQLPPCNTKTTEAILVASSKIQPNPIFGFFIVCILSLTSAFAGVYFEKVLKSNKKTSIFGRNLQMGFYGLIFSTIMLFLNDGKGVLSDGFFYGYNGITWCIILVATFGGILVAIVVQYTDNITKGFATSISIILNCLISSLIFDFQLTLIFIIGTGVVISSSILYSDPDNHEKLTSSLVVSSVASSSSPGWTEMTSPSAHFSSSITIRNS